MIPKYLYHYTSLESLYEILKNKTIRFKVLSLFNDPLEAHIPMTSEGYNIDLAKYYIYASCWSNKHI